MFYCCLHTAYACPLSFWLLTPLPTPYAPHPATQMILIPFEIYIRFGLIWLLWASFLHMYFDFWSCHHGPSVEQNFILKTEIGKIDIQPLDKYDMLYAIFTSILNWGEAKSKVGACMKICRIEYGYGYVCLRMSIRNNTKYQFTIRSLDVWDGRCWNYNMHSNAFAQQFNFFFGYESYDIRRRIIYMVCKTICEHAKLDN